MRMFAVLFALVLSACGTTQPAPVPDATAGQLAAEPAPAPAPATGLQAKVDSFFRQPNDVLFRQPNDVQRLIDAIERDGPAKIFADLDAATAYGKAQGDLLGPACYPAIKTEIASLPPLPAGALRARIANRPPPVGAVTAFEYLRVDRTGTETSVNAWRQKVQGVLAAGPPQALMLACGGLIQDERNFIARLIAAIGIGSAATAVAPGLGPLLPGLAVP